MIGMDNEREHQGSPGCRHESMNDDDDDDKRTTDGVYDTEGMYVSLAPPTPWN